MLDQATLRQQHDVAGKAAGFEWATVRALILLRLGPNRVPSPSDIESARANYAKLMPSTAERVVGFWRTRTPLGATDHPFPKSASGR